MISDVLASIERVFRYLLPGVVFVFLFKLSYPIPPFNLYLISDAQEFEFYIYLPTVGAAIYSLHRLIFEIFDFGLSKFNFDKYVELMRRGRQINKEMRDYLEYKLSMVHFTLIFAELLFIFSTCFYRADSFVGKNRGILTSVSVVIFIVSMAQYLNMYRIQRKLLPAEGTSGAL